jgi:hypothetical protein
MDEIKPISKYGPLDQADIMTALYGLSGSYAARDLYKRYASAAREAGRVPAHPVSLGQEFKRRGFRRVKVSVGGVGRGHRAVGDSGRAVQVWAWYI